MNSQTIIFFDGVCHLCNTFVNFLIRADKKRLFKYAPLQGTTASTHLSPQDRAHLESVIVWIDGATLYRSQAVLTVLIQLGGPYSILSVLKILPSSWLDFGYQMVARHRYEWFGKKEFCRIPTPSERDYLLP